MVVVPSVLYLQWEVFKQVKIMYPSDSEILSDWVTWLVIILTGLIVPIIFLLSQQVTKISKNRVYITCIPFWKTSFALDDIKDCYIREFKPLAEFGGWGIRIGLDGVIAYTSYGTNKGIQFELKSGKKVLIGSSKINTFNAVIKTHLPKNSLYSI